jgi:copper transport protein
MPFSRLPLRRLLRSLLIGGIALWMVLAAAVITVAAHAELAESNPPNGTLLEEPPEEVTLTFTQELDTAGSNVAVFDQDGQQVDQGNGGVDLNDLDHKRMAVSLPASLADGTYTVRWTAMSAEDGDTTDGAISFTVGTGENVAAGEASQEDTGGNSLSPLFLAGLIVVILLFAAAFYFSRKRDVRDRENA